MDTKTQLFPFLLFSTLPGRGHLPSTDRRRRPLARKSVRRIRPLGGKSVRRIRPLGGKSVRRIRPAAARGLYLNYSLTATIASNAAEFCAASRRAVDRRNSVDRFLRTLDNSRQRGLSHVQHLLACVQLRWLPQPLALWRRPNRCQGPPSRPLEQL